MSRAEQGARPATGPARPARRPLGLRVYELAVALPLIAWIALQLDSHLHEFASPMLLLWTVAIALVDLFPVPASIDLRFSLSFPLQLAVALIYSPPIAALVAFLGTSDQRELHREMPIGKSLFNRAQIALSVAAESALFHTSASLRAPWLTLGAAVLAATVVGYAVNVALVSVAFHLTSGETIRHILRAMHVGIFGEFLVSYMGLALFGVLIATSFVHVGVWSIAVFVAPLAFARQMFLRTHSLEQATTELARQREEQEHSALHDALTGLPNRVMFLRALGEAVRDIGENQVAVLLMDLDDFKEINDTLGHHIGDLLLQEIGPRLGPVLREGDVLARLGGDEFGIVLTGAHTEEAIRATGRRLLDELERPVNLEGLALEVSASIGAAVFPRHADDLETIVRLADVAMYTAKGRRTGVEVYAMDQDRYTPGRIALISQMRAALEEQQLLLYYQPKIELGSARVEGVEALVRWRHPERGIIDPDGFIPLVERTVLVRPLALYVLDHALAQLRRWDDMGLQLGVAVNLSARNLLDAELPGEVAELLERWRIDAGRLTLELTESALLTDPGRAETILRQLAGRGVRVSVDDFGTGYSSLSYLRRLPVQEIKVDKSFVTHMRRNPGDAMIVKATIDLSRSLGLQVVAEGVEDEATAEDLAAMGCDLAQGYALGRPLAPERMTPWLLEHLPPDAWEIDEEQEQPPWFRLISELPYEQLKLPFERRSADVGSAPAPRAGRTSRTA